MGWTETEAPKKQANSGGSGKKGGRKSSDYTARKPKEVLDALTCKVDLTSNYHAVTEKTAEYQPVSDENLIDRQGHESNNDRGMVLWLEANCLDEKRRASLLKRYQDRKALIKGTISAREAMYALAFLANSMMSPEVLSMGARLKPPGDGVTDVVSSAISSMLNTLDAIIKNQNAKKSDPVPFRCGQLSVQEDDLGG